MTDNQKAKIRIVTEIGPFLKQKANSNLKKGLPLIVISYSFLWFIGLDYLPSHIDLGNLAAPSYFLAGIIFCYGLTQFITPYKYYMSGLNGERKVVNNISKLGSVHNLFNDVGLKDGNSGNIDHIIVGPRGIFVIETKNISGKIAINGNYWKGFKQSPSIQAIKNAQRIRKLLENALNRPIPFNYVRAIVVLTNPEVTLDPQKLPEDCKIIMIKDTADNRLRDYILSFEPTFFSREEVDEIVYYIDSKDTKNS